MIWVCMDADGDEERELLEHVLGIHPLLVDDAFNSAQSPKVEDHGDYLYLILHGLRIGNKTALDVDTTDLQLALAPGSAMLAIGEPAGRAAARVRVFDMHTGAVVAQSAPIETLSALGWRDPTTVVIAAGNPGSSEVSTMALTATGFAPPVPILRHEATGEWIGGVSFFDGKLVAVVTHAIATTHLLDLQDTTGESGNTVLDARTAAAAVGWRDATTLIVWNRAAGQVEDLALATGGAPASPPVPLVDEPFNATRAGELMIVTTRTRGGRQVSAFGPGRATPRWQGPVGELLLVRCAGDVAPPCVALVTDGDGVAMRQVDPTTGELAGAVLAHAGDVFDLAVSNDGSKLAWTDETWRLRQRGLGTNEPERVIGEQVVLARTVAFAPDGAVLVGFLDDARRLARFMPGEPRRDLWKTRAPVVSLVRPSPDGRRIAFRERSYASVLMIEP